MKMSDTPRTDGKEHECYHSNTHVTCRVVECQFARELERELNELSAESMKNAATVGKLAAKITSLERENNLLREENTKLHGWCQEWAQKERRTQ